MFVEFVEVNSSMLASGALLEARSAADLAAVAATEPVVGMVVVVAADTVVFALRVGLSVIRRKRSVGRTAKGWTPHFSGQTELEKPALHNLSKTVLKRPEAHCSLCNSW